MDQKDTFIKKWIDQVETVMISNYRNPPQSKRWSNIPDKREECNFLWSQAIISRDGRLGLFCKDHNNEKKESIVDLLLPDSKILFEQIISCISEYVMGLDLNQIDIWLPENHFLTGHALSSGFKNEGEPIGIIPTVALFEHSPSLEWVKSNLYYNMGDGDLL